MLREAASVAAAAAIVAVDSGLAHRAALCADRRRAPGHSVEAAPRAHARLGMTI